ncbi:MAG: hypothetical protein J6Y24_03680 [Bacteroidales bacterium]|nr:hypothetical protein [Bacteroidales bacterium]
MNNNLSYLLKLKRQRRLSVDNSITTIILIVLGVFFAMPLPFFGFGYATIIQPNTVFDELTKVIVFALTFDVGIKCVLSKSSIAELCALKLLPIPKYELYLQNIKNKFCSVVNYITHLFTLPLIVTLYVRSQLTLSYSIIFLVFYTLLTLTNTFIVIWIKSFNGWKREFLLVLFYILYQSLALLCIENSNVMSFISNNLIQSQLLLLVFSIVLLVLIVTLSIYQYENEFIKFLENKSNASTDIVSYGIGSRFNLSPLTRLIIKATIKNINVIVCGLMWIVFLFIIFRNQEISQNPLLVSMVIVFLSSPYLVMNNSIANISLCFEGISSLYNDLISQINKTDIKINYIFAIVVSLSILIASKDINIALNAFFISAGVNAYLFLYINTISADRFDIMSVSFFGGHYSNANLQKFLCAGVEMICCSVIWYFVEDKYIITIATSVIFVICLIFQKRILEFISEKFNQNRYKNLSIMRGF